MATFEEKILAYLDGSLAGDERDEVLRAVSDSPERRALLDEHLRLQNLYTYAAKPVSAPLALQRELASQIPLLAIKLPYLAPVENRRKGAIAGFWNNATSRISGIKTSWINTILVVLVALLAGGLWYLAKHSSSAPSISSSTGNSSNNLATPNGTAPSGSTPNNVAPTAPDNSHAGVIANDTNRSSAHERKSASNISKSANAVAALHRNIEDRSYSASSPSMKKSSHAAHSNHLSGTSEHSSANSVKAKESSAVANILTITPDVNANNGFGANSQSTIPADTIGKQTAETPHDISSITSLRNAPITANRILPQPISIEGGEKSYVPVLVFASNVLRMRSSALPSLTEDVQKLYSKPATSSFSNIEVGADYELTPWLTAGIMGGQFEFLQWQQQLYRVPESGSYLTHYARDYSLQNVATPWIGLDAKYTINPANDLTFAVRGGVGLAFIPNQSSMLGDKLLGVGQVSAAYNISERFGVVGGIQYDATSLGVNTTRPSNPPGTTIGILNKGNPDNSMQSAFGVSLGISYHP
jgi:hypothetical protein